MHNFMSLWINARTQVTHSGQSLKATPKKLFVSTCTCGTFNWARWAGITIFQIETLQARRSCTSSLETFTQSCRHCAWPKRLHVCLYRACPRLCLASSSPALRARRCRHMEIPDQLTPGRLTTWPNQRGLLCMSYTDILVGWGRRCSSACTGCTSHP